MTLLNLTLACKAREVVGGCRTPIEPRLTDIHSQFLSFVVVSCCSKSAYIGGITEISCFSLFALVAVKSVSKVSLWNAHTSL
jgi:hypothetical protein